ncbi:MAG: cache domain-containing protein [Verrucomicrobia bacterium]|nr:cache domain-containing protein [Verrucomicrobiota bacterium]
MMLAAFTTWAAGPEDEALALTKKAVEFWKANGKEKAVAAFSDPKGGFVAGSLYVFVNEFEGTTLAHGGNPKLVGKNMKDLKDADGKLFIQEMAEVAKKGGGWVKYKWTNPETKKIQDKATYVQAIPEAGAYVGCGIYR